jgi:toxin FitB
VKILLDTVVLSELRKARPSKKVLDWFKSLDPKDLFISVITLGEIERGIAKVQKSNPQFASQLAQWLDQMVLVYAANIVPFEAKHARLWGRLSAKFGHDGADVLIACSALCCGMAVATRNDSDFAKFGVDIINPF